MTKNMLLLAVAFFSVLVVLAQTGTDASGSQKQDHLKISGGADVYYKYDFAKTAENSFTSFTQSHNQFNLGMAALRVDYTTGKVGMVADLGFGPAIREINYTDEGVTQAIKQLYISYAPATFLKFTVGTWSSHVGYEVPDARYNRNYSMSYMFTNGPVSHTGLKAEFTKNRHGLMAGIANASDYRSVPGGLLNRKFLLAQYSFVPSDRLSFYLNYVGGQHPDTSKSRQYDLVSTIKLGESFSLAFNGTYSRVQLWDAANHHSFSKKPWWGTALYLNYDPTTWLGLTFRSELFNDHNHLKSLGNAARGDHIFSNTLSANFKKAGFTLIPELRYDHVNKKGLFTDVHHVRSADDFSVLVAAIYAF